MIGFEKVSTRLAGVIGAGRRALPLCEAYHGGVGRESERFTANCFSLDFGFGRSWTDLQKQARLSNNAEWQRVFAGSSLGLGQSAFEEGGQRFLAGNGDGGFWRRRVLHFPAGIQETVEKERWLRSLSRHFEHPSFFGRGFKAENEVGLQDRVAREGVYERQEEVRFCKVFSSACERKSEGSGDYSAKESLLGGSGGVDCASEVAKGVEVEG